MYNIYVMRWTIHRYIFHITQNKDVSAPWALRLAWMDTTLNIGYGIQWIGWIKLLPRGMPRCGTIEPNASNCNNRDRQWWRNNFCLLVFSQKWWQKIRVHAQSIRRTHSHKVLKSVNSDDIHFDFVDEDTHNNESGDTKKFLQKIHKSMKVPWIFLPIQYSFPSNNQLDNDVVFALERVLHAGLYSIESKE